MNPGMPHPQDPIQCPNMAKFTCPDCKEELDVMIRRPMIANGPGCTVIAFTHETPDTCPKCGAKFLFKVIGIDPDFRLRIVWLKLPSKESALVAGSDANMQEALARVGTIADITGRKQ